MRRGVHLRGVVQGVGFRPFVFRLATEMRLTGFVGNNSTGVFVEVQGDADAVEQFMQRLQREQPPLASIALLEQVMLPELEGDAENGFVILASAQDTAGAAWISPDIAACEDCLREMRNPADRRYRYPFINCTNCGPRFTITIRTPYDRAQTTMARFTMCAACQAEYDSPLDRRFHAQPNACAQCGPQLLWMATGDAETTYREDALEAARRTILHGGIVAVKGIGGFHLAVDATNDGAVARLRERKHRYGKPLAVMVADIKAARTLARISPEEERLLGGAQRPIVLLEKAGENGLASAVAPGTGELGVLLPYTPLHALLLEGMPPLVMTSGNLSQQPIAWQNEQAMRELAGIADGFLLHDREIHVPCDDSVTRVVDGHESPLRRSRGYAPLPSPLPGSLTRATPELSLLAVGAELKSTFCLTRGREAFLSQHLGDMESFETLTALERAVEHLRRVFRTEPAAIACDLHPGYLSSRWAAETADRHGLPLLRVQHHHAHLAAVMAENGVSGEEPVIGIVFDGTGYGTDGTIWGGECLIGSYGSFRRHLRIRPLPLPGGDAAIRHPYRTALAAMHDAEIPWDEGLALVKETQATERRLLQQQLQRHLNVAPASSMGRLFDAVACIAGLRRSVVFEAQAAIELEALAADPLRCAPYAYDIASSTDDAGFFELDTQALLRSIVEEAQRGISVGQIAGRFHRTVIEMTCGIAQHARGATGLTTVALTGGVWQNRLLARVVPGILRETGFKVLQHQHVPCNDGGLALGQAAVATAMLQTSTLRVE